MTATAEQTDQIPGQTTVDEQAADAEKEQSEKEKRDYRSKANSAYNAAWSKLREKYREEYDALLDQEFESRGLVHRKRATSEQAAERAEKAKLDKAKERFDKLLAEYPALAENLKQQPQE